MQKGWRQFRPRLKPRRHVNEQDFIATVRLRLEELLAETGPIRSGASFGTLSGAVREQAGKVVADPSAVEQFLLLILRAPAAVRAQQQMDEHTSGYHDRQARLYELIDFNDAYVSTVLALSDQQRSNFVSVARSEIDWFCKQIGSRSFTDKQYEAITRGLGREVAVYLGAIAEGYTATMTSRSLDALGVDMIIGEPATGKRLSVDCKTASAYHYRLQDLVQQGRLSKKEQLIADQLGYVREINGHDEEVVTVTLLRIDPNEVGDIRDFRFTDTTLLGARFRKMFKEI